MIAPGARVSISNIAWPDDADDQALTLVRELGFAGLDLAPGKVFSAPTALDEARAYRRRVEAVGLRVVGFQALVFGGVDVALFGSPAQRKALATHLTAVARLAGATGASTCVFGAPRVRRRGDLDDSSAFAEATAFFGELAGVFEDEGACLAMQGSRPAAPLKYEIAEIALVQVPDALAGLGVTVMDGPYFSCMPFPAAGLHSLTHVRYTPHYSWTDHDSDRHPLEVLQAQAPRTRVRYMVGDAARYLPLMREVRHERSLFEVKTVLLRNEVDDGRPILFQRHPRVRGVYAILGGKIDNVFDIESALDETFRPGAGAGGSGAPDATMHAAQAGAVPGAVRQTPPAAAAPSTTTSAAAPSTAGRSP